MKVHILYFSDSFLSADVATNASVKSYLTASKARYYLLTQVATVWLKDSKEYKECLAAHKEKDMSKFIEIYSRHMGSVQYFEVDIDVQY